MQPVAEMPAEHQACSRVSRGAGGSGEPALFRSVSEDVGFVRPAGGATAKLAFTGTSIFDHEISPAEEWENRSAYHLRNMVWVHEVITSDRRVTGWDTVVINFDLALDAWEVTLWGKDRLEPAAYPDGWYDCTWQGTWTGEPWAWAGKVVCHGGGSLTGWQLRYAMSNEPEIAGYAFRPGS